MERIFIYCTDSEKRQQIETVTKSLRIKLQSLSDRDLTRTIGAIAGITKPARIREEIPDGFEMHEILIFSGLNRGRLDAFLKAYKEEGIPAVDLKAVVTMSNSKWSLYRLMVELGKEHERMAGASAGTEKQ